MNTVNGVVSTSIVGNRVQNIEVNGRSPLGLLRVVPGLYMTLNTQVATNQTGDIHVNGTRGDQFNITLNGASNLDTGSNTKVFATASLDSIQEMKILTGSYDARYGKAGGAQIIEVTKSGTSQFHGSGCWYYRDRGMNANDWFNNREGNPKPAYHFNDAGYTIGGPIYIPGNFNTQKSKLFFFWSDEYQPQSFPHSVERVTVPTAAERQGDFSHSYNITGSTPKLFSLTDPISGGPLGVIPSSEQYAPGLAALSIYPMPNVKASQVCPGCAYASMGLDACQGFNYESQLSDSNNRHEQLLRVDANLSPRWHLSGSWTNLRKDAYDGYYCPAGHQTCTNFPLAQFSYYHPGYVFSVTADTTLSPTMTNEATFDVAGHTVTAGPVNANALTTSALNVQLPTFYPSYASWIPDIEFSGGSTGLSNAPSMHTGGGVWAPFKTVNRTFEWIDNLSKVWNNHLIQSGFYWQYNQKPQSAFAPTSGAYNFGDANSNPLNTGYAFANAALGIVGQFTQANNYVYPQYRYNNIEWYIQDTWKVTPRLSLDYGVRFYWVQPWYDTKNEITGFFPDKWSASQAPEFFWPCLNSSGAKTACVGSSTGPLAIDPSTGQPYANPGLVIGKLVPGTGSATNGILQAGKGINKYTVQSPGILLRPRLSLAYDLTGHQNLIFRVGAGAYYDRYQGNEIFNVITNPPTISTPTVVNTMASDISLTGNLQPIGPSGLTTLSYNGNVPTVYNYSAGIEAKLPWAMVLSASYAGSHSSHLIYGLNLNPIPFGADWLPQNQDPTKVAANPNALLGSNAYSSQFLRPFQGYNGINEEGFGDNSNYNSLQVTLERRFASGLFLDVAYTWGKCMDEGSGDGASYRFDGNNRLANYGPCDFDVHQNLTFDYVYPFPRLAAFQGHALTRGIFNGWQISGITTFRSGLPFTPGYSFTSGPVNTNNNLTGTPDNGARLKLVGDPYGGTTSSPYDRLNATVFLPPTYPSLGLESGRNYLNTPGVNDWDMSLQRNVRLTEHAQLQFRVDAFNVWNHTQFSGIHSTLDYTTAVSNGVITYTGPTNLPYNSSGQLVNLNGFGTVSGDRGGRVIQTVVRVVF